MKQRIFRQAKQAIQVKLTTVAMAALVALVTSSCISDIDTGENPSPVEQGRPTVLAFQPQMNGNSAATRAETYDETYNEFSQFFEDVTGAVDPDIFEGTGVDDPARGTGRTVDRRIDSLNVLVFYGAGNTMGTTGDLVYHDGEPVNHMFHWISDSAADDDNKPPFKFELTTGVYDFVFVANHTQLDCDDIDALKAQMIDGEALSENETVPAVAWFEGVTVARNSISFVDRHGRYGNKVPGATITGSGTWDVIMERAAIRLSFGLRMSESQFNAWKVYHLVDGEPMLYVEGFGGSKLFPFTDYAQAVNQSTGNVTTSHKAHDQRGMPGKVKRNADGTYQVFFDRLILPEHIPTDKTAPGTALSARLYFDQGNEVVVKEMAIHAPFAAGDDDYSLRRNTWAWVKADFLNDTDCAVKVVPWGDAGLDPVDILQNRLTTDRSGFLFHSPASEQAMNVFTDLPEGWKIDVIAIDDRWMKVSPMAGSKGTTVAKVEVGANTTGKIRTAMFTISAGNLSRTIVVTQLPASDQVVDATVTSNVLMYAGAFWKASQYGERLIQINRPDRSPINVIDGFWTAYVLDGEDWIVLDTAPSDRTGEGNDPGFDAAHRVSGYATSVSGKVSAAGDKIYFRIGLNGRYTPTAEAPARYGVVLLAYGGYMSGGRPSYRYRRIWVRQGEQPDYLIPPGYDVATYPDRTEENVLKFSPYNLTAPGMSLSRQRVALPTRGGVFTEYPTQAGAMFQFANPRREAFAPLKGNPLWTADYSSTWSDDLETCPPGYRRPVATVQGNTVDQIPSEPSLSLLPRPDNVSEVLHQLNRENVVPGLYADGFFDRRTIEYGTFGSDVVPGVSTSDVDVAWSGVVLYNKVSNDGHRNASIFFPYAGGLNSYNSDYLSIKTAHYWTSTELRVFDFKLDGMHRFQNKVTPLGWGNSIRCVSDGNQTTFRVSQPDDFSHNGDTHSVDIESIDPDGFTAPWEVAGYDADNDGTFAMSEKPAWLLMPESGGGQLPQRAIDVTARAIRVRATGAADVELRTSNTQTGTLASPWDLSTAGGTTPRNTANCYVVNGPGSYKLPLVYGNAIKNGANNPASWAGTTGVNVLGPFVRHDGQSITGPDLPTAVGATLVWTDSPGLVGNVRLVDGNRSLAFNVDQYTIVQGNAIVAVLGPDGSDADSEPDIMWSWHIWVTHKSVFDATQGTSSANTFEIDGGSLSTYKMMRHNIGWIGATNRSYPARSVTVRLRQTGTSNTADFIVNQTAGPSDNTTGRNPYYQWGRKDPMAPAQTNRNEEGTLYGPLPWTAAGAQAASLSDAIRNPDKVFGDSTSFPWLGGTSYRNLWDGAATRADIESNPILTTVKTVYDPSPVGFRVPVFDAFTFLVDSNFSWLSYNPYPSRYYYSPTVSAVQFPATGWRSVKFQLLEVGITGLYWAAHMDSSITARYISFDSTTILNLYAHSRALSGGLAVRPIVDADPIFYNDPPIVP
jgi:hypothetical protein